MKKSIDSKTLWICSFLFSSFLLLELACNTSKKTPRSNAQNTSKSIYQQGSADRTYAIDELIIWKNPKRKPAEFEKWLENFKKKLKGKSVEKNSCGNCDDRLKLLSGPGIQTLVQDLVQASVTSNPRPGTTGDNDTAFFSLNYRMTHKKPGITHVNAVENPVNVLTTGDVVRVAVFDTGIDPQQLSKYSFNSPNRSCIPGASAGYNVINPGKNFIDDDDERHGTIVTHFITEQVNKYGKTRIEILPVKTHDANGVGDLYGILCAFAYAQQMGVQIINASFGYYSPCRKDVASADPAGYENALLLRKYIDHYLTQNDILLVTAAGNEDDYNEKKAFDDLGLEHYYPSDHRNLDQVAFLPASFARSPELPNVIAVTTVYVNEKGKGEVSSLQNFSKNVVDIGVNADAPTDDKEFGFYTPLLKDRQVAVGSSFAAPIVTGILAAHYPEIKAIIKKRNFKKEDLWKKLGPEIIKSNQDLKDKVKKGLVMDRQ